ncbi:MAG: tetratricopeptide repeat protein [Planctomycetes bacterium]|nr:tetratricopeptide repeat protein [Planctomycetota bacterium]
MPEEQDSNREWEENMEEQKPTPAQSQPAPPSAPAKPTRSVWPRVRLVISLVALAACLVVLLFAYKRYRAIALMNEGTALNSQGQMAECLAKYEKAVEMCPTYQPAQDMFNEALAEAADHFSQSGQHEKAVEALEKLLARKPDHPKARGDLAFALFRLKKMDEALQHAQEQVKRSPDDGVTQRLITTIQRQSKAGKR